MLQLVALGWKMEKLEGPWDIYLLKSPSGGAIMGRQDQITGIVAAIIGVAAATIQWEAGVIN